MCDCNRNGFECIVRVFVGEPETGYWICQKDLKKELKKTKGGR
jgi:hypothetical protein